eukprot:TRINITY_DN18648_c0_g1_i1.p1 TRINITY_DN18648_c0_g1~~TRINITY_DN18648_c0_g1_i1.p1  ORF type:complete len:756 (-),score=302.42 TRINITY_DN18648_c0_g1_i1:58-2292(-)
MADRPLFIVAHPINEAPLAAQIAFQFTESAQTAAKFVPKKDVVAAELTDSKAGVTALGALNAARFFARLAEQNGKANLYAKNLEPIFATQIDQWVDFAAKVAAAADEAALAAALAELNVHLTLRTVLVEYSVTLADIAVWAALHKHAAWAKLDGAAAQPNVSRWYRYLAALPQFAKAAGTGAQAKAPEAKAKPTAAASRTGTQGDFHKLALTNAEKGKVVTRFPPEPSGYAHIGHCKAALLNQFYADYYGGKLIIRFDDTNPTKEKDEYVQSILQDLATMGVKGNTVSYTSDFFPQLLKYAEQLIKIGKGFVDNTPVEQMRNERMHGIESKARNQSVEENLRLWKEMVEGTPEGLKCVLRGKIDMKEPNKCLRDPALYRCVNMAHHRVGNTYKAYPLYDFACPIVDSLEGVTHALRSSEYHDRNPLYNWVVDTLGLRRPCIEDFARLNFAYTLLSKRKLQWFVEKGQVDGWNDPRFPTVQGMLRRGLTVEALKEFILAQGASKTLTLMEPEKLWAVNKKIIDPNVARYTAIVNRALVELSNGSATEEAKSVPKHRKNLELGNKTVTYSSRIYVEREDAVTFKAGEEITLMNWGNAIVDAVDTAADGTVSVKARLHLEGNVKDTEKKLNWVAASAHGVQLQMIEFDNLITKKKLDEDDNFEDFVNPVTKYIDEAFADAALRLVKKGERIQLERRGYYICDEAYTQPSKPMVFFLIPDGHNTRQQSTLSSAKDRSKVPAAAAAKKD